MSVTSQVFYGVPNSTTISDSSLAYSTITRVQRSGVEYDVIFSGTPGSRQVKYVDYEGKLIFLIAFNGSSSSSGTTDIAEDIIVTYTI